MTDVKVPLSPKLRNANRNYYKYICIVNAEDFVKFNVLFAKFADAGWHGTTPLIQCRVASDGGIPPQIQFRIFPRS